VFKSLLRDCLGFFKSINRLSYSTANAVFAGSGERIPIRLTLWYWNLLRRLFHLSLQ